MIDAQSRHAGQPKGAGAADLMGSSASAEVLNVLRDGLREEKNRRIAPLLERALVHIKSHEPEKATECALQALQIDEVCGLAWHLLAIAREASGDFVGSLSCYEAAHKLLPEDSDVLINLGRLAFRMDMYPTAEKLFAHFLSREPDHPEGVNNLALAMGAQDRKPEAIRVLEDFISRHPTHANLWNSLGSLLAEEGEIENAEIFLREALRLNPRLARARYNLGSMKLDTGAPEAALKEVESALKQPLGADEKAMMTMTQGLAQLALGRVSPGWRNYEARNDLNFPGNLSFAVTGKRWKPGQSLAGESLLLIGEQGLGDEVLFAGIIPDVLQSLGPQGHLTLAVEPRLKSMMARSFPSVRVLSHHTIKVFGRSVRLLPDLQEGDAGKRIWSPIASLLQQYRARLEDFPARTGYLQPDPGRVAHWRSALARAPAGPKVGLLWKSAVLTGGRGRFFSPFESWRVVLQTPGVVFVNLQYGDCGPEIELARQRYGVEIWTPPGIDLKQDLDDVVALSCALDLVVGFSNASFNLAAAAGAPCWMIAAKGAWTALGTGRYPWYPQVQLYQPDRYGEWGQVLERIAGDLGEVFPSAR